VKHGTALPDVQRERPGKGRLRDQLLKVSDIHVAHLSRTKHEREEAAQRAKNSRESVYPTPRPPRLYFLHLLSNFFLFPLVTFGER
jgi:hypothetical protein